MEVDKLNPNHNIDIQQLWAQVYYIWKQGEQVDGETFKRAPHWLTDREATLLADSNKAFEALDPIIEKFDNTFVHPDDDPDAYVERMGATQLCEEAGIHNPKKVEVNRLANTLLQRGFKRRRNDKKFSVAYRDKQKSGVGRVTRMVKKNNKRNEGNIAIVKDLVA